MSYKFVQIHFFTAYPSALLNRDDAGFAKRIPFGGVTRTRISSQCLKRHWRTYEGDHSLSTLDAPRSVRSRLTFDRLVARPLIDEGVGEALVISACETILKEVLGQSEKAKKTAKGDDSAEEKRKSLHTGQITVLGQPEIDYMRDLVRNACAGAADAKAAQGAAKTLVKEQKKNLRALKMAAGLDAALFGRMVTSDNLARGDAALHVAHAFTVHEEETEADYFSAVDDLSSVGGDAHLGAGHINSTELTSGLYYGYLVVDLPLLVSNLTGCPRDAWEEADHSLAGAILDKLVHLVATVSPGAKLGSTAPYAYASLLLVEIDNAQPRTLANAFLTPVKPRPDILANTCEALARHLGNLDRMYGATGRRAIAGLCDLKGLADTGHAEIVGSITALGKFAASALEGGNG